MQGYLEKKMSAIKAAFVSGLIFGFGHCFLATTVTSIGAPLLIFTSYEGVIAGLVRARYGLVGAAVAHGVAVFVLASGLF